MKRRKTEMKMKKRSCFLFSMEEDVVNLKKSVSLHTRVKERCDINGVGLSKPGKAKNMVAETLRIPGRPKGAK